MTYSDETVEQVWQNGRAIAEQDPAVWREDECGAWMRREHYAREESEYGWKIQNVSPGGGDVAENLRPFQCRNSYHVGDRRPKCRVTADRRGIDPHERLRGPPRNRPIGEAPT